MGEGGKEGGGEGGKEGGEGGASSKRPREMLKEDWVMASRVRERMASYASISVPGSRARYLFIE